LENNIKMDLKEQRVRCQLEACGSPWRYFTPCLRPHLAVALLVSRELCSLYLYYPHSHVSRKKGKWC
jgi:hypothetical protein